MNNQSKSIANFIENSADENFNNMPLPHKIRDVAVWHLLTVAEDWGRMMFAGDIEKPPREIEAFVDQIKYSLRHCLDHIIKKSTIDESFPIPTKTIPPAYIKGHELIAAGMDYAKISRIFSSIL